MENYFEEVFTEGFRVEMDLKGAKIPIEFKKVSAGSIHLDTDKVYFQGVPVALGERFAPGQYAVEYALAKTESFVRFNSASELVSCVRIVLADGKPVRWEKINDDIRIESAALQIADPAYVVEIEKAMEETDDFEEVKKKMEVLDEMPCSTHTRINGKDAIDIHSGFGDGTYSLYAGFDETGIMCRLVCDFEVTSVENWEKYLAL